MSGWCRFGFIKADVDRQLVFVHASQLKRGRSLRKQQRVRYSLAGVGDGRQAIDVEVFEQCFTCSLENADWTGCWEVRPLHQHLAGVMARQVPTIGRMDGIECDRVETSDVQCVQKGQLASIGSVWTSLL